MASLGSLVVTLAADTARFQGDLGRAATIAESRMRHIKDVASRSLGAVAVAATAAGAALVASLKAATDRADSFTKLAQGAGVTVEEFSRLEYAAKLSGTSVETLQKALAKLAAGGSQNAREDLLRLADTFAKMPDGAAKTAKAVEVFGQRIGPNLVPLLNQGRAGIEALAKESDAFGNTISTSAGRAAEQFNDNLTRLRTIAGGFSNTLAAELLPSLGSFTNYVVAAAKNGDTFRTAVGAIATALRGLVTALDFVITGFVGLGKTIRATFAAAASAAKGDFSKAWETISQRNADAEAEAQAFADRYVALWDGAAAEIASKAPTLAEDMVKPVALAANREREILQRIAKERAEANETTRLLSNVAYADSLRTDLFDPLIEGVQGVAIEIDTTLVGAMETATEEMSVYSARAAENMQDAFANFLFDPFKGGVRGMLSEFVNVLRRMAAEAAAAKIFDSFKGSSLGGIFSGIGKLFGGGKAAGGPVSAGTPYLIGERGPELFVPGTSGSIVPNDKIGGPSITYAPVYNITSGVTRQELLPALEATRRQTITDVTRLINGGAFAG